MSDRLREALGHAIAYLIRPDMPPLSPDQRAEIANHLRRFLALTETGQRVEWCETHEAPGGPQCLSARWFIVLQEQRGRHVGSAPEPCSIVPKLLADYLTEETETQKAPQISEWLRPDTDYLTGDS